MSSHPFVLHCGRCERRLERLGAWVADAEEESRRLEVAVGAEVASKEEELRRTHRRDLREAFASRTETIPPQGGEGSISFIENGGGGGGFTTC